MLNPHIPIDRLEDLWYPLTIKVEYNRFASVLSIDRRVAAMWMDPFTAWQLAKERENDFRREIVRRSLLSGTRHSVRRRLADSLISLGLRLRGPEGSCCRPRAQATRR